MTQQVCAASHIITLLYWTFGPGQSGLVFQYNGVDLSNQNEHWCVLVAAVGYAHAEHLLKLVYECTASIF